jgi:hypothetical protein
MTVPSKYQRRVAAVSFLAAVFSSFFCAARAQVAGQAPVPPAIDPEIAARISAARTNAPVTTGLPTNEPPGVTRQQYIDALKEKREHKSGIVVSNGVYVIPYSRPAVPLRVPALTNASPEEEQVNVAMAVVRQKSEEWTRVQHDLIYSDPDLKKLNDQIRKLEKEILDMRQLLHDKEAERPEMIRAEKEREDAFNALIVARKKSADSAPATRP